MLVEIRGLQLSFSKKSIVLTIKKIKHFIPLMALALPAGAQNASNMIWKNNAFSIYSDKVLQGAYTAQMKNATHFVSDYKSLQNAALPASIGFKISINGQDNESPSGQDHYLLLDVNKATQESPIIIFGNAHQEKKSETAEKLTSKTILTLRVDMREVLKSLHEKGYYTTFSGKKIYKADFKGVYVAGGVKPLIWDFDNLVNHPALELKDPDGDGIYTVDITFDPNDQEGHTAQEWTATKDVAAFPQYHSPYAISDALYNLSLEEMKNAVEPDSTFRTGKDWSGVWTRDISYSIILSMAHLQPRVAYNSLMRKVNGKKIIIQDTGTGGAWPCSSDRVIWAVAAWELYEYTGDQKWLTTAYEIIRNTLAQDEATIYDAATGLVKGESSFLDWREQTYPRWMQPADIYESECLGTNAVHFQANIVAAKMAKLLGKNAEAAHYNSNAKKIKDGINKYLWLEDKGYYAQYLYGRNYKIASPKSETLGEALCIIWNIADAAQQKRIVENIPVVPFGAPCVFPQIPGIPPYHNNAVWPFVQSYWMWAAAKVGNAASVSQSIASIYRPAALFATNKENFVAETGDYAGTQINSSNMLWSLSGNLSIVHRILFGLDFQKEKIAFHPFIPKEWKGNRTLKNVIFREAILDIDVVGYGDHIAKFSVDGKPQAEASFAAHLKGKHKVSLVMSDVFQNQSEKQNIQHVLFAPETPEVAVEKNILRWKKIEDATHYIVWKNGKKLFTTTLTTYTLQEDSYGEFGVTAVGKSGTSFMSEPILVNAKNHTYTLPLIHFAKATNKATKGYESKAVIEISNQENTKIKIPVKVQEAGWYTIDFHYANGNGPTNTENKCAIRTLTLQGANPQTIVFPQRGKNEWSNWGFSNNIRYYLKSGENILQLERLPQDDNMNGEVNMALLDYIRLIRLKE